jgi:CheY-like chemotaxis protein
MAYKLLLADDSQTIQKVVELILNREEFDILACSDGEEAVKAIESGMPDIVLADIEMPKVNGYQLCEQIKGSPATDHIPVILLAGAFEPFDEDYARSVGADDFIMKPFESNELVSKVKSLLVSPRIIEMPAATADEPVAEEPAATAVTAVATEQATEWFESYPFDQQETIKAEEPVEVLSTTTGSSEEIKAFDDELRESLQKLEEEDFVEIAATEEDIHEEISLEEISKMVKEAIGEPPVPAKEESVADLYIDASKAEVYEPSPLEFERLAPEPVQPSAVISKEEIKAAVLESISAILPSVVKESVERAVSDTVPNLLEEALRESINEMSGYLHNAVNAEIKKVMPGIADAIIKREIEKITSELM